jgi:hypothetical protein
MAVNFGAPGDWRAGDGTLWFAYPHPPSTSWYTYGVDFDLKTEFSGNGQHYFRRNFQWMDLARPEPVAGSFPWVFASGCRGMERCVVPLLDDGQGAGVYTVRLYFVESEHTETNQRVFDVKLQDKTVLKGFDILAEAGGANTPIVKEFRGVPVENGLSLELIPRAKEPSEAELPILNGLELIQENLTVADAR